VQGKRSNTRSTQKTRLLMHSTLAPQQEYQRRQKMELEPGSTTASAGSENACAAFLRTVWQLPPHNLAMMSVTSQQQCAGIY
jgi:hypothetical protein